MTGNQAGTYDKYTYYTYNKMLATGDTTFRYGSYAINACYRYGGVAQPPGGTYLKGMTIAQIVVPAGTIWAADSSITPMSGAGVSAGANYLFGWSCLTSSSHASGVSCTNVQPTTDKGPTGIVNTSVKPNQIDHMIPRHAGNSMVNCIYCDGHAKAVSPDQILATKIPSGKYAGYIGAFIIQDH